MARGMARLTTKNQRIAFMRSYITVLKKTRDRQRAMDKARQSAASVRAQEKRSSPPQGG